MIARGSWFTFNTIVLLFLALPQVVVAVVSVSPDRFLSIPTNAISFEWYRAFLFDPEWIHAFAISALIAAAAASISTAAAIAAAIGLERARPHTRNTVELLALAPLIFPHAAIGLAFYGFLLATHVLFGTLLGVAVAHVILCVPFAYRPIAAALQKLDPSYAEAAMNLGARNGVILRRVLLPLLRPGIVTALLFTFILSFDEITVTLFLMSPTVTTLPLQIYAHLEQSVDPVVAAVSTLLILLTLGLVLILQRTIGLELFVNPETEQARTTAAKGD